MSPNCAAKNQKKSIHQEGFIENAIRNLKSHRISSGHRAADIYGIPPTSLHNRHKGARSKAVINAEKRKLTINEEEILIKRILSFTKQGFPPWPIFIEYWANLLLANQGSNRPIKCISINWKSTFINHYPEVKSVYS
jgi:hypothetical protein